jgi:hypothetical protein
MLAPGSQTLGNKKEPKARWLIFVMLGIMAFGASKAILLRGWNHER